MVSETTDRRRGREFAVRKTGWYLARFAGLIKRLGFIVRVAYELSLHYPTM